jgi:multidrug efflux pump subunit AcrB
MILFAFLIGGIFSAIKLPLDKLPELISPRVTVETVYEGMSAEDIRSVVTIPIEDALSPVKGLERMRSISRDDFSLIILDFRWGTNVMNVAGLVREAIDMIYPSLPEGAEKPLVNSGSNNNSPQLILAVSSNFNDAVFERRFSDYELRARLRRADGAGEIIISGGKQREIKMEVDNLKAIYRGITPAGFAQIIAGEAQDVPAGSVKDGNKEIIVVSKGRPDSVQEFSKLIISDGKAPLRISDIGNITEGAAKQKSIFIFEGKEQTSLEIYRRSGANPIQLSNDVKRIINEANNLFSRDVTINIVYDDAPTIIESIENLCVSAIIGTIAVIVILFIFINNIKISLLAALSIPVSASVALLSLFLCNKSINSMSLSGIAMGIGLVSDTSVIMLDVLLRKFEKKQSEKSTLDGKVLLEIPNAKSIGSVAASISASSFGSTVTTVIVFVPIIFLPGPLGELFSSMSIAIVGSVMAGWLFAQFALPSLFRLFYDTKVFINISILHKLKLITPCLNNQQNESENKILKREGLCHLIENKYKKLLRFSLRNPKYIFIGALLLSIAGFILTVTRPAVFVPSDAANEIIVEVQFPSGTRTELISREAVKLIGQLNNCICLDKVFANAGSEENDRIRRGQENYQKENLVLRCLIKKNIKPDKALAEVKLIINFWAAVTPERILATVDFPTDKTAQLLGISSTNRFAIKGSTRKELEQKISSTLTKITATGEGEGYLINIAPAGKTLKYVVKPKREKAALLGINTYDLASILFSSTDGMFACRLEIDGMPVDMRVSGAFLNQSLHTLLNGKNKNPVNDIKNIEKLPVSLTENGLLFLGSVADIVNKENYQTLARLDRSDVMYINIFPKNNKQKSTMPEEKTIREAGMVSSDESVFAVYRKSLFLTAFLVVILLYLTIAAQFESFLLPLIFMLSIPFSLAGAGPALFISCSSLDSGSALALLVLFGLVVNGGMVLYETCVQKFKNGCTVVRAVYEGALSRLKPVVVTTLTTIIVLFPPAFAPLGATQKSMAITMIGACIAVTLLTLFVMPLLFFWFLKRRNEVE